MLKDIIPSIKPFRPYLFEAAQKWFLDNGTGKHRISVITTYPGVVIPDNLYHGSIELNIFPGSISDFGADDNGIYFKARFSGASFMLYIPYGSMVCMYEVGGAIYSFPGESCYSDAYAEYIKQGCPRDIKPKPKLQLVK